MAHKSVFCTGATFLEPQLLKNLLKFSMFAHIGQLDMHPSTQASAQVRWAGEDVAQVLVPHEGMAFFLEQVLNLKHNQINEVTQVNINHLMFC